MDELFLKSAKSVGKIVLLCTLLWFFMKFIVFAFEGNMLQIYVGLFIFTFITLPTIFWIFFKDKLFAKFPKLAIIWKVYRIFYIIFIALWLGLWALGYWRAEQKDQNQKVIDFINSKKITMADVMGQNLPPKPDQTQNDSTIAGIDANNNYIRDDVELAIFEKYPNSAKIRSAMLQYAQALQLELTKVSSSETFVALMQKDDDAGTCLIRVVINLFSSDTPESKKNRIDMLENIKKEVYDNVLNIDQRKNQYEVMFEKYMQGYAASNESCDVDLSSLPN